MAVAATAKESAPSIKELTSLYTHSSQYGSYLLTEEQLEQQLSSSSSSHEIPRPSATLLQQYYLYRIPLLGKAFGLNERVTSTGMTYFKRYWIGNETCSVVEPFAGSKKSTSKAWRGGKGVKLVMLICLYLSTKTHSSPISLHSFASLIMSPKPSATATQEEKAKWEESVAEMEEAVRDHEFHVASVLGWKFRVTHAFEGVRGILLDLQTLDSSAPLAPDLLNKCASVLNTTCAQLRLTNAEFLYTQSQLALGIWWCVLNDGNNTLSQSDLDTLRPLLTKWIGSKSTLSSTISQESLTSIAEDIAQTRIKQARELELHLKSKSTLDEVKAIDLKLKEVITRLESEEANRKRKVEDGSEGDGARKSRKVDSDDEDEDED